MIHSAFLDAFKYATLHLKNKIRNNEDIDINDINKEIFEKEFREKYQNHVSNIGQLVMQIEYAEGKENVEKIVDEIIEVAIKNKKLLSEYEKNRLDIKDLISKLFQDIIKDLKIKDIKIDQYQLLKFVFKELKQNDIDPSLDDFIKLYRVYEKKISIYDINSDEIKKIITDAIKDYLNPLIEIQNKINESNEVLDDVKDLIFKVTNDTYQKNVNELWINNIHEKFCDKLLVQTIKSLNTEELEFDNKKFTCYTKFDINIIIPEITEFAEELVEDEIFTFNMENSRRKLSNFTFDKIAEDEKSTFRAYYYDIDKIYTSFRDEFNDHNYYREKIMINGIIDFSNENTLNILENLFDKTLKKYKEQEEKSNDIYIKQFCFEKDVYRLITGNEFNNEIYAILNSSNEHTMSCDLVDAIHKLYFEKYQFSMEYSRNVLNNSDNIIYDINFNRFFINLENFYFIDVEKVIESYNLSADTSSIELTKDSYISNINRHNCLKCNRYNDGLGFIGLAYCMKTYGTQVYREFDKLNLRVSRNAEIEENLTEQKIAKRLFETHGIDYKFLSIDSFNSNNTINVTKLAYRPDIKAGFYIDAITHETVRNTYQEPMIDDSNSEDFTTIRNVISELFVNNDEISNAIDITLGSSIQGKSTPDAIWVLKTDSAIDIAFNIINKKVLKKIIGKSNCITIDGLDLLGKVDTDDIINNNVLIVIKDIPTALNETYKKQLNKNLNALLSKKDYQIIIIKTSEVDCLDIKLDPGSYNVVRIKSHLDISKLGFKNQIKLEKQLVAEVPAYYNFLKNLDLPNIGEIEAIDNEDKKHVITLGNRIQVHINAYLQKDIEPFETLLNSNNIEERELLGKIKKGFNYKKPYVSQQTMISTWIAMENSTKSREDILSSFRAHDPIFFDKQNATRKENSDYFYHLNSSFNKYFNNEEE